jgi:hypothetical protein
MRKRLKKTEEDDIIKQNREVFAFEEKARADHFKKVRKTRRKKVSWEHLLPLK